MIRWNKKGFSLIELMVVVSIIGIITLIAIPSYRGFQAKARQKEGFNLLSGFYTAATTTRAEFGYFPGNLVQTGYQPVGQLGYRLRSEDGMDLPNSGTMVDQILNDDLCTRTFNDCDCGMNCPNFKTWDEGPTGMVGTRVGIAGVVPTGCSAGEPMTADFSFRVAVSGIISTMAMNKDVYYITETKFISMCQDGLK